MPLTPSLPPIVGAGDLWGRDDIVLCDVRWYLDGRSGEAAYLAGHIPGAIFVDLNKHLSGTGSPEAGRHPLPTAESFVGSLAELGIGQGDPVVAYDDQNGLSAGRLVWMLRVLGQNAALLDGGLTAWNGAIETAPSVRQPCDRWMQQWPDDAWADIDAAAAAGAAESQTLIDARGGDRYRGESEPIDARPGHIPGAVNVPFSDNLIENGHFASAQQLRDRYESAGAHSGSDTIVYCGSGVSACVDALAMERAGLGRPRIYVGSWSQWSRTNRPAEPA